MDYKYGNIIHLFRNDSNSVSLKLDKRDRKYSEHNLT